MAKSREVSLKTAVIKGVGLATKLTESADTEQLMKLTIEVVVEEVGDIKTIAEMQKNGSVCLVISEKQISLPI